MQPKFDEVNVTTNLSKPVFLVATCKKNSQFFQEKFSKVVRKILNLPIIRPVVRSLS